LIECQTSDVCKVCTVCGNSKPLGSFSPHAGRQYGRDGACKACRASRRHELDAIARRKRAGKDVRDLLAALSLKRERRRLLAMGECLVRRAGGPDRLAKIFMELIEAGIAKGGHAAYRSAALIAALNLGGALKLEESLRAEAIATRREQRRETKRALRKADRQRKREALRRIERLTEAEDEFDRDEADTYPDSPPKH
jgi:hypothetical protein